MGVEWGGGGTRRPLLRRTRAARRCTYGCCICNDSRKHLRHKEAQEVSRMLDDMMWDDDWLADRYQAIEDEARYYDEQGFPTHTDSVEVECDDVNHTAWHGCPTCEGWWDEYDPDDMCRGGDDAYTTARRSGEPTYREVK